MFFSAVIFLSMSLTAIKLLVSLQSPSFIVTHDLLFLTFYKASCFREDDFIRISVTLALFLLILSFNFPCTEFAEVESLAPAMTSNRPNTRKAECFPFRSRRYRIEQRRYADLQRSGEESLSSVEFAFRTKGNSSSYRANSSERKSKRKFRAEL